MTNFMVSCLFLIAVSSRWSIVPGVTSYSVPIRYLPIYLRQNLYPSRMSLGLGAGMELSLRSKYHDIMRQVHVPALADSREVVLDQQKCPPSGRRCMGTFEFVYCWNRGDKTYRSRQIYQCPSGQACHETRNQQYCMPYVKDQNAADAQGQTFRSSFFDDSEMEDEDTALRSSYFDDSAMEDEDTALRTNFFDDLKKDEDALERSGYIDDNAMEDQDSTFRSSYVGDSSVERERPKIEFDYGPAYTKSMNAPYYIEKPKIEFDYGSTYPKTRSMRPPMIYTIPRKSISHFPISSSEGEMFPILYYTRPKFSFTPLGSSERLAYPIRYKPMSPYLRMSDEIAERSKRSTSEDETDAFVEEDSY